MGFALCEGTLFKLKLVLLDIDLICLPVPVHHLPVDHLSLEVFFSCAPENVVAGHTCKNRITAGKRPRAQRRGKKEKEFKYNSLKNEYSVRKIIYFSKY